MEGADSWRYAPLWSLVHATDDDDVKAAMLAIVFVPVVKIQFTTLRMQQIACSA